MKLPGSDPDNSGDFTGRWIQCKKKAVSLQWTGDLNSASVGLTIPVEFNSSAADTQFYSCTPPSSVSCENDPDGNGFVACPTINGCVTCPSSHPYPAQHWTDDAPLSWMGDKRTICKTCENQPSSPHSCSLTTCVDRCADHRRPPRRCHVHSNRAAGWHL